MSDPRETLAALQDHVIDRRRFLAFTGALAGTALYAQMRGDAVRAAPLRGYPFRLGVASGDPEPTAVSLWTRLAPEPLAEGGGMPLRDVAVRWELARDDRLQEGRAPRGGGRAARARALRARRRPRPGPGPGVLLPLHHRPRTAARWAAR